MNHFDCLVFLKFYQILQPQKFHATPFYITYMMIIFFKLEVFQNCVQTVTCCQISVSWHLQYTELEQRIIQLLVCHNIIVISYEVEYDISDAKKKKKKLVSVIPSLLLDFSPVAAPLAKSDIIGKKYSINS